MFSTLTATVYNDLSFITEAHGGHFPWQSGTPQTPDTFLQQSESINYPLLYYALRCQQLI